MKSGDARVALIGFPSVGKVSHGGNGATEMAAGSHPFSTAVFAVWNGPVSLGQQG